MPSLPSLHSWPAQQIALAGRPQPFSTPHMPFSSPPRPVPTVQVHAALSPQLGGSAFASLEEIVARLARAKVRKMLPRCACCH